MRNEAALRTATVWTYVTFLASSEGVIGYQGAYLAKFNTLVSCASFVYYLPACSYFTEKTDGGFYHYQVPTDMMFMYPAGQHRPTCQGGCFPLDGPGGVLHQGELFITSIGGFNMATVRMGQTPDQTPSDLVTYLKFQEKKIVYTKRLPFKRMRCIQYINGLIAEFIRSNVYVLN